MEITGPNSLWKDYDVDALPFNATLLSDKTENGVVVRELYFNGFATVDGMVRAFLKIYVNPSAKGYVLYMSDGYYGDAELHRLYESGFNVAALDFFGKADGKYTLYPISLADCNSSGKRSFEPNPDVLKSRWFIWTCIARRAIRYLRGETDLPIYAVGKGLGGSTVYKLCAFDDGLTAAATELNILPDMIGTAAALINYRAALDNFAYAPITKVPLMMAVSSNDESGSLDVMSELAQSTASLKVFRIVERAFDNGVIEAFSQIVGFFEECSIGVPKSITSDIKAINSENKLYFNIKTSDVGDGIEVKLYSAFCIENASYRNWTDIKIMRLGDGEYIAHADVLQNDKPVYAFVNATDADGNVYSSLLLDVVPKTLGIPSQPAVRRRLIYDGSMGADVWTSPKSEPVVVKKGVYDIDGVTSKSNHLVTFKPGDLLYRAEGDVVLQLLVCGKPQKLNVGIFDGKEKYFAQAEIPNSSEFCKFTLSLTDFKGSSTPDGFSSIIMLEIIGDDEFIVSSVLWV